MNKRSVCAYCGCACYLDFVFENGELVNTLPNKDDYASRGMPCIKGLSLHESLKKNRLMVPQIRINGELKDSSWKDAYSYIHENLKNLNRDEVFFIGSGEYTNETNYLMSKFARTQFKTNNVDCCARLCHSATGAAFNEIFGIKAIPKYTMDNLEECDLFLSFGSDPKADYPVMYHRIKKAKDYGAKIVVIDVGPSTTSEDADLIVKISPNGIVPLLSQLMKVLIDKKDISKDAKQFDGFDRLFTNVSKIADRYPLPYTNLHAGEFEELYRLIDKAKKIGVLYGMGATQQHNGTQNVKAIAAFSILMNAVLFSNRGKVNVQGSGDVGSCPKFINDSKVASKVNEVWGMERIDLSHKGMTLTEAMYDDKIKAVWVMGTNPAQSMPDLNQLHEKLKKKFIVYMHHHGSKTMEFADVVLPSTMLPEENGTITNGERRIRKVDSIGHDPKIRQGWQILSELGREFDNSDQFKYGSAWDVTREMLKVIPAYSGINLDKLSDQGELADKEPKFISFPSLRYENVEHADANIYPFSLTTARTRFHFCTGEGTRNSDRLMKLEPQAYAYFNPEDAEKLEIRDGDMVRLVSSVGEVEVETRTDEMVLQNVIVVPYHYEKVLINYLTPLILDPESKTPCYKEVNVFVEKV